MADLRRQVWLAGALMSIAAAVLPHVTAAQTSIILGAVEDSTGRGLGNVRVGIVGTDLEVVSDSTGRFRLGPLRPATYILQARRLGYAAVKTFTTVADNDTVRLGIELTALPAALATVMVEAEAPEVKLVRVGFVNRKLRAAVPASRFMTRVDFERREPLAVSELLRRMGGFTSRCPTTAVVLDGMKIGTGPSQPRGARGQSVIDAVSPKFIEAVEAYAGPAEVPAEFQWAGGCVVLIWTRLD